MKDSLEKGKFLEIDCDEIPAPFHVLQGYWVVQNLYLVMIFAWVVQINCYCGDWVTCDTAADKLRFLLLGSQCLRAFNRGFILLFWLFLLGMRGNLLIYRKMSISRLLWGDRWKLHGEIQPTSTCFKWHKNNSVSSEDFRSLKFLWKKVQHSESGRYEISLRDIAHKITFFQSLARFIFLKHLLLRTLDVNIAKLCNIWFLSFVRELPL